MDANLIMALDYSVSGHSANVSGGIPRERIGNPCAEAPARRRHQPLRAVCGGTRLRTSMFDLLQPNVIRYRWQLLHPYGSQIVTCIPLQRLVTRVAIPVR